MRGLGRSLLHSGHVLAPCRCSHSPLLPCHQPYALSPPPPAICALPTLPLPTTLHAARPTGIAAAAPADRPPDPGVSDPDPPPQCSDGEPLSMRARRKARTPLLPKGVTPLHMQVLRAIKSRALLQPHDSVLIAVSGGQDSVCLARLLLDLSRLHDWQLQVAHCDHCWRQDSAANAKHVAGLASSWGLPFHLRTAPLPPPASEASARAWRYGALAALALELGCRVVVTGHTASDRAETLLFNLMRGAGADGMQALSWSRPLAPGVSLARPMLGVSRQQTGDFCAQQHLAIWEDSTNSDNKYRRNRIRNELLPYLRSHFNPRADEALARTAGVLQDEVALMEQLAGELLSRACDAAALKGHGQEESQGGSDGSRKAAGGAPTEAAAGGGLPGLREDAGPSLDRNIPSVAEERGPAAENFSSSSESDTEGAAGDGQGLAAAAAGLRGGAGASGGISSEQPVCPRRVVVDSSVLAAAPVALQRRALRQLLSLLVPDIAPTYQAVEELLLLASSSPSSSPSSTGSLPRGIKAHTKGKCLVVEL